ncbi:hypothetical protein DZC73_17655 [Albitalea terrae]|uniref:Uncharacterized protein n=1 Tax=Piscinibacter terrae TaxID=2496871 RepID=A0A3N7HPB5_9BURK|nr:hypothetical protein DZC73_17655 [Albitalea terrae]
MSAIALAALVQTGWCADGGVAELAGAKIAAVQQPPAEGFRMTPEVSAVRSRLPSNGPTALSSDGSRTLSELAGVDYKLWTSHGRVGVGVGVGTLGYVTPRPDGRVDGPVALSGAAPSVSVGLRYHVTKESTVYADASGVRGLGAEASGNYVNTKVGMEWKPAQRTLGFEHGALGMQLDSGYRLALKPSHGGLGLYLRGKF